jgi:hypothetical protein
MTSALAPRQHQPLPFPANAGPLSYTLCLTINDSILAFLIFHRFLLRQYNLYILKVHTVLFWKFICQFKAYINSKIDFILEINIAHTWTSEIHVSFRYMWLKQFTGMLCCGQFLSAHMWMVLVATWWSRHHPCLMGILRRASHEDTTLCS